MLRRAAAVLAAAVALTAVAALPAVAEPNYPPSFTRISADRTIVAPRIAGGFVAQTFAPGSRVDVSVTGTSAQRTTATANADGVARASLAFAAVGTQTVSFAGVDPAGSPLTLSTKIQVVPAGSDGSGDNGSGSTGTGASGPGGQGAAGHGSTSGPSTGGASVGGGSTGAPGSSAGTGSAPSGSTSGGSVTGGSGSSSGGDPAGAGSTDAGGAPSNSAASTGSLTPVLGVLGLALVMLAGGVLLVAAGVRRRTAAEPRS